MGCGLLPFRVLRSRERLDRWPDTLFPALIGAGPGAFGGTGSHVPPVQHARRLG